MEFSEQEIKDIISALAYVVNDQEDFIKDTIQYLEKDKSGHLIEMHSKSTDKIIRCETLMKRFYRISEDY